MATRKKTLLIINPISGTLPKDGLERRVRERLEPEGFEIETAITERAGHARELAVEAASGGFYAVIVAGGDGTVNEVGAALAGSRTAVGILPYGSGNGLARHILTSIDVDHALDVIAKDSPQACDYGCANGMPFFCTFGLGFDANVSREFAAMHHRGILSYIRSALTQYMTFSPAEYEIKADDDNQTHTIKVKAFIVAVCNASQYGNNAFIAPQASISDGMLDLVIIHSGNPLTRAIASASLFTGRLDRNLLIDTFRVSSAQIRRFPGPAHIDGEPHIMPETLDVECRKGEILLFTDPDKQPFKPFITPLESMRDDSQYLMRENVRIAINNIKQIFNKK